MYSCQTTNKPASPDLLALLADDEAAAVLETSSRDNTVLLTVMNSEQVVGYAVFGKDQGGMLAIYCARSMVAGIGGMAMKALFGASKIMGTPLRVHADDFEAMKAKAKLFGADMSKIEEHIDADGILQGVFNG